MTELFASTLRLSTPLIFAAMGGLLCERSGIATICLEGVMITSAWTAAVVNYYTGDPYLAMTVALFAGAVTMGLHAFLSITTKADQIVSAVAVNLIAAGMTPLLNKSLFGSPTNSPSIPLDQRFGDWVFPLLNKIPFIGPALFEHKPLIYLALILPFVLHYMIRHTGLGLRLLAAGDGPEALQTSGVSPGKVRYVSLLLGGALASQQRHGRPAR